MKVCYTAIIGKYDHLKEPTVITPNWDYICFTDQPNLTSKTWRIVLIDNPLSLENTRLARQIKILGHQSIKHYEMSIWIDASVEITTNLDNFLVKYQFNDNDIMLSWHAGRDCIYAEAQACIRLLKDNEYTIRNQMQRYREQRFPKHYGLVQTGIIVRKNNKATEIFCQEWWNELSRGSKRDQLSFNYIVWKLHQSIKLKTITPKIFYNDFQLYNHTPNKERLKQKRKIKRQKLNQTLVNRRALL